MFNTTTIPTQVEPTNSIFIVFSVLGMGLLLGFSMIELFLYGVSEKAYYGQPESEDEEEEDNQTKYTDQYRAEFEALAMRELTAAELLELNTKIVREQVAEKVEVILTFDKLTETFCYYTDQLKEVSYDILETVARKFAIEYDCKMVCLPAAAAVAEQPVKVKESPSSKDPSVFAKFKNYNTGGKGSTPNFTSVLQVIDQMNHFRYRGKLCDYEETLKNAEKPAEPSLDYSSYKKLLDKKEN